MAMTTLSCWRQCNGCQDGAPQGRRDHKPALGRSVRQEGLFIRLARAVTVPSGFLKATGCLGLATGDRRG